jgi:beta-glucosidase
LYPFGYGLSYTTFGYENLKIDQNQKAGDAVKVSVTVKNTGAMRGDEVVQAYVSHINAPVKVPVRSLAQFQRVSLDPGESRQIDLTIAPEAFTLINGKGEKSVSPGQFEIAVGSGQPGLKVGNFEIPGLRTKVTLQ